MLIWFVVLYLLVSIGIGLVAATRVHSAKDFAIAGHGGYIDRQLAPIADAILSFKGATLRQITDRQMGLF